MTEEEYAVVFKYCHADCVALAATLETLQRYCADNDLDLAGTIGSASYKNLRRKLGLPDAEKSGHLYRLARRGYYGGRVQVFRAVSRRGYRDDINSAYSAALCETRVPLGPSRTCASKDAARSFGEGVAGIYQAHVRVDPDTFIPPLPYRDDKGRVRYPVGDFSGAWTGLELAHAVENGASIKCFGQSITWEETSLELAGPIRDVWNQRLALGKEHAISKWLKFYLNAPTGKCAENPEQQIVMLGVDNPEPCPGNGACMDGAFCGLAAVGCCPHRCTGACGSYRPLGFATDCWTRTEWKVPPNGHIQWAAYLTAAARVKLHTRLLLAGTSAVYCDTDCVFSEADIPTGRGSELGEWLFEGVYAPGYAADPLRYGCLGVEYMEDGFTALAPKTYRFRDGKGKVKIRSKGIAEPNWFDMRGKVPMTATRGVAQFRTALRSRSMFEARTITRTLKHDGVHYGDRVRIDESALTYPTTITGDRP